MKKKHVFRKLLASCLAVAMLLTLLPVSALAATKTSQGDISIITKTNYNMTQGVSVSKYTLRDSSGAQTIGYMTEIDLSKDVRLVASYTGYYTSGSTAESRQATAETLSSGTAWNLSQTTQQAAAYESARDAAGKVIWATNGDYYNMQTGSPTGYLIMEGNLIKTGEEPFFAILKDGTAVIRDPGSDTSDVQEAVSGPFYLIQNGQVVYPEDADNMPRNSVGIRADGTVVFFEADGRQSPYSSGLSVYETACMMKEAGCVTAIYLDGGGSATVAARTEGSSGLSVFNSPSDGIERTVSSAFLAVSTAEGTGRFDHAVLTPNNEQYTLGSVVQFEATGADSTGGPAELPESGLSWVLDTAEAGTMDAATGVFTAAAGYRGEVAVHVEYNGENAGATTIVMAEPDSISFASDALSLDFNKTSDLGLIVSSNQLDINCREGDFVWTITPDEGITAEQIGSFRDNLFTSGAKSDTTLTGTIAVSYTNTAGEVLSASIKVEIGKMPVVAMDFETPQKNGLTMGANSTWGNFDAISNQKEKGISGVVSTVEEGARADGVLGFGTADGKSVDPNGITIPATIEADENGKYGTACGDFVNGTGDYSCYNSAPYGWDCVNDPAYLFNAMGYDWTVGGMASATAGPYDMYAQLVDSETGEVRFGEHALEFHYDFTKINGSNNTNEYLCYTGDTVEFEGSPSAIGMWVYAPEGTPNYWFTMYVYYWNGSSYSKRMVHFKTTTVNAAGETVETTTQYTGLNWTGWQYVEADITSVVSAAVDIENHPIAIVNGARLIDMIIIEGGTPDVDGNKITCGARAAGSIYIDNIRAVYGTTVDDMENPVIDSVRAGSADETNYENLAAIAEDGSTILETNDIQIFARYHDPSGENATGISAENTRITVDGTELTAYGNTDQAVANVTLSNGRHTVTVEVMDGFGNKTSKTYDFTVAAEDSELPVITLTQDDYALLGGNYNVTVSSEDVSNISSVTLTVAYGNSAIFDESVYSDPRLTNAVVSYGDGFTGVEYQHTVNRGASYVTTNYSAERKVATKMVVNMTANADEGAEGSSKIINFSMPVPATLSKTDNLPVSVNVQYKTKDGAVYTLGAASTTVPAAAYYTISADTMIAGAQGGNLYVTTIDGDPAAGVTVRKADGTEIGTTDVNGVLNTTVFTEAAANTVTTVVAEKNGMPSFATSITTRAAGSNDDGTPSQIELNATQNAATSQSITWMSNPLSAAQKAVVKYAASEVYKASGACDQTAEGTAQLHEFKISNNAAYINTVCLTDLEPATEYTYFVGDGEHWSEARTFTTDEVGADTTFFVIGDTQLGGNKDSDAAEIALMNGIATNVNAANPDFGIQTGDFVDNGGRLNMWNEILDVYDENYATIPMVQVLGNHEYYGDVNGTAAEALWNLPDELYYSVEYGNVYVAVINYAANLEEASQWLIEDAAKSDCQWKILAVHQPAYYTNPNGSSAAFNRYIPAAAEAAGINAVFSGHDHSYARTNQQLGGVTDTDHGIVYFICGDLGEKSRESSYKAVDDPAFNFAKISQEYTSIYLMVTTNHDEMVITAYDVAEDGTATAIDSCTIKEYCCQEHDFVYDRETGRLSCPNCIYNYDAAELLYTGFVTDSETGKKMYLNGGEPQNGHLYISGNHYYFEDDGLAYDGEYEMCGETVTFKDGQYVEGSNPNVISAGKAGPEADFIVTTDGLLNVDGTGSLYAHSTYGTVQWYPVKNEITALRVGKDITALGSFCFSDLFKLEEVYFEEGSQLGNCPNYCFANDASLKALIFPETVKTVGFRAFAFCKSLEFLYLPDVIQYFGDYAFDGCSALTLSVLRNTKASSYAERNSINALYRNNNEEHSWTEWTNYTCADNDYTGYRYCTTCGVVEQRYGLTNGFEDVAESDYYYNAVLWASANKVVYGTSETTFAPGKGCTRAEIVAFLWRNAGCPAPESTETTFTDIDPEAYYYDAVLWANENGIVYGTSETTFAPNKTCTRAETVAFLYRAAGCPTPASTETAFTDIDPEAYYYVAVLWATENGIVYGTSDTTFAPAKTCTRAQVVAFLYRAEGAPEV